MPARISSTALAGARYDHQRAYSGAGRARVSSLPLTVSGSASQHHHRRRHHVGRQPLGQRGAHLGRVGGPGDITHQALVAGAVLAGDHHRLLHPVQPGQRGLDFAEFDAIPADLDLLIGAPHDTPAAHRRPSTPDPRCDTSVVPGPPRTGTPQTATRSTRPGPIANPHAAAGHIQLPDHPGRHRPQPPIQHKQRRPRHRRTDRRRTPDPAVNGALIAAYTVVSVGP